jgi:hypothetical protein
MAKSYYDAVDQYKSWLKSPEGINSTDNQKRLKRRSLFIPTNRVVDTEEVKSNQREALVRSQDAENIRRLYEFTRRSRPNLTAKSAFSVMAADNPALFKKLTADQFKFLYDRYVSQDQRRRGDSKDISNSVYDSNMNPANSSALRRATFSGAANLTTNVGKPAVEGLLAVPRLAGWSTGKLLTLAGANNVGNAIADFSSKGVGRLIPTKSDTADYGIGYKHYDAFNRAMGTASALAGGYLGVPGSFVDKASKIPYIGKAVPWLVPRGAGDITFAAVKAHPIVTGLSGMGLVGSYMYGPKEKETGWGDIVGGAVHQDKSTGEVAIDLSNDRRVLGTNLSPADPGVNLAVKKLGPDHPLYQKQVDTVLDQRKAVLDAEAKNKLYLGSLDKSFPITNSAHNPNNPSPPGSGDGDKVSWWDSLDEQTKWKIAATATSGLVGATAGSWLGGWKGALLGTAMAGLGYAYGDKLPEWWNRFISATDAR